MGYSLQPYFNNRSDVIDRLKQVKRLTVGGRRVVHRCGDMEIQIRRDASMDIDLLKLSIRVVYSPETPSHIAHEPLLLVTTYLELPRLCIQCDDAHVPIKVFTCPGVESRPAPKMKPAGVPERDTEDDIIRRLVAVANTRKVMLKPRGVPLSAWRAEMKRQTCKVGVEARTRGRVEMKRRHRVPSKQGTQRDRQALLEKDARCEHCGGVWRANGITKCEDVFTRKSRCKKGAPCRKHAKAADERFFALS